VKSTIAPLNPTATMCVNVGRAGDRGPWRVSAETAPLRAPRTTMIRGRAQDREPRSVVMNMRRLAVVLVLGLAVPTGSAVAAEHPPLPISPCRAAVTPADGPAPGLHQYVGAVHEHSAYSDGYIGTTPSDYYRSGRCFGLNFLFGADHSDFFATPIATSDECLERMDLVSCAQADPYEPANSLDKYGPLRAQADAEQTAAFTTAPGFEWSSDRFGHINGYFAQHWSSWLVDGTAAMKPFYDWVVRPAELGGGSDGLFTFNHPGDKSLCGQIDVCKPADDPGFDWSDFAYDPRVDPQMVGLEVFNGDSDFGSPGAHEGGPDGHFAHALDKGWHVGAVGAEDKGHKRTDRWGSDALAKTVIVAPDQDRETLKEAMRDRRFYATLGRGLTLGFTVDGAGMGARIDRTPGDSLHVKGALRDWRGETLDGAVRLDLITNGGRVAATTDGDTMSVRRDFAPTPDAAAASRWYFLRASRDGRVVAYSSPVWIEPAARAGEWLAGDLHVHTCFSHDVFCGPLDQPFQLEPGHDPAALLSEELAYVSDPEHNEEIYASGQPVGMRFEEAAIRGLDYLAITDHNDTRSVRSRGFGAEGVIGIPGYEDSIRGHAQVLGERQVLDNGDGSATAINALAARVHEDGGVFQANHPMDGYTRSPFSCDNLDGMHWSYGFAVQPDTIEVWNLSSRTAEAELYLECWLDRGVRMGVTGGSDSHWTGTAAVQGVGNPTTWVLAGSRTRRGVLAALRSGRTSVSRLPPAEGGAPLLLEARTARGDWVQAIGETVRPGTAMRVRSTSPATAGLVTVRANSADVMAEAPLVAGGSVTFTAPGRGWVRASLHPVGGPSRSLPDCGHELPSTPVPTSLCPYDATLLGLTSPAYVDARRATVR
jgi:predicted metal-dependent phosphoesterase TrpH